MKKKKSKTAPKIREKSVKMADTNGYNAMDPSTNPTLFNPIPVGQAQAPNDPLLDVMNASGQNPARPPIEDNTVIHKWPLASVGTETYAGYPREEYLHELFGKDRAKIYDKMWRSDTQCKMLISSVVNTIRSAVYEIEPAGDDEASIKQADLIRHIIFDDIPLNQPGKKGWPKFINEASMMVRDGHAVFEKTYRLVTNHPRFGNYHGVKSLDRISPKTIYRWNLNPDGGLISVTQISIGDLHRYVNVPAEFLMTCAVDMEGSNFEGVSMLRPCYGPWLRKNLLLKLNAIGSERFAVPTPVASYEPGFQNQPDFEFLVQALEMLTSGESNYITKPKTVDIEFMKTTFEPDKLDKAIDSEDRRMTKAFLANFLELAASERGSFALSEDLSDFFLSGLEHIASEICHMVNSSLIPELCNMNFGPLAVLPKLKHSGITDKAGKELSDVLSALTTGKIIQPDDLLEENIRKRYGLPEASLIGRRDASPPPGQDPSDPHGGAAASSAVQMLKNNPGEGGGGKSLSEQILRRIYG